MITSKIASVVYKAVKKCLAEAAVFCLNPRILTSSVQS
jgi:hypothetical protein